MQAINKITLLPLKELDSGALVLLLQKYILDAPEHFDAKKIFDALNLATYLHREATRSFRHNLLSTPYIEHPLRNATRLLRDGCTSERVIIAVILHDTVEDCAEEIVAVFLNEKTEGRSESELRSMSLSYIGEHFGAAVERIVRNVSNAILEKGISREEKNIFYVSGLKEVLYDADTYATKYTDLKDNALGLHHNYVVGGDNRKTVARAVKYLMAIPVFEAAYPTVYADLPMSQKAKDEIPATLEMTRKRLEKIVALG